MMSVNRRDFLKKSCLACASIAGIGVLSSVLQSCSSLISLKTYPENGVVKLNKSKFTEENHVVILKNFDMLNFDIAVVKFDDNTYKAIEMQCTHVPGNHLIATNSGFHCNTHGSAFNLKGEVTHEPASRELKEYPLEISSETIIIHIS